MYTLNNKINLNKRSELFESHLVEFLNNYGFEEQDGFKESLKSVVD